MQILSDIKAVLALVNSRSCDLCVANVPYAGSITRIFARVIHRSKVELDSCDVALNNSDRRLANTLNGDRRGAATATTATFNDNSGLDRAVLQQVQLGIFISDIVLAARVLIGLKVLQCLLNLSDIRICQINRILNAAHRILQAAHVAGEHVNGRLVCFLVKQRVSSFLIIIGRLQGLRQVANTILQLLHGGIICGLIFSQLSLNRGYGSGDFAVVHTHPLSRGIGIQLDLCDLVSAVQECQGTGVVIILHIKVRQTINSSNLAAQHRNKAVNLVLLIELRQLFVHACNCILCVLCALLGGGCSNLCFANLLTHCCQELGIPVISGRVNHLLASQRFQHIQSTIRAGAPQIALGGACIRNIHSTGCHDLKLQFALFCGSVICHQPVEADFGVAVAHVDRGGVILLSVRIQVVDLNRHLKQVDTIVVTRHFKRNNLRVGFLCDIDLIGIQLNVFVFVDVRPLVIRVISKPNIIATTLKCLFSVVIIHGNLLFVI